MEVILVMSLLFVAVSALIEYRATKVKEFVVILGDLIIRDVKYYKFEKGDRVTAEKCAALIDKFDFNRMVFSCKPIQLEFWYTEDEIQLLRSGLKTRSDERLFRQISSLQ